MRNLKLLLSYDGTDYCGWQVQPRSPSIQGELSSAIRRLTGENVLPQASGRTDAAGARHGPGCQLPDRVGNSHRELGRCPQPYCSAGCPRARCHGSAARLSRPEIGYGEDLSLPNLSPCYLTAVFDELRLALSISAGIRGPGSGRALD